MASHGGMIVRPPAWENCLALEPKSACVLGRWGLGALWIGVGSGIGWNCQQRGYQGPRCLPTKADMAEIVSSFFLLEVKLESFGKSRCPQVMAPADEAPMVTVQEIGRAHV